MSRRPHPDALLEAASKVGMELTCLTREECDGQRERLDRLFARCERVGDDGAAGNGIRGTDGDGGGDEADDEVARRRRQRKEEKRARKMAKVAKGNAADGDACDGD